MAEPRRMINVSNSQGHNPFLFDKKICFIGVNVGLLNNVCWQFLLKNTQC